MLPGPRCYLRAVRVVIAGLTRELVIAGLTRNPSFIVTMDCGSSPQ